MLVPLPAPAWGCCCQSGVCALEGACWCHCRVCCCRVLVGVLRALSWSGRAGAAAGCCLRVLLSKSCVGFGALVRARCGCRVLLQQGAAVGVVCALWR